MRHGSVCMVIPPLMPTPRSSVQNMLRGLVVGAILLASLAFSRTAEASHFRGGTLQYQIDSTGTIVTVTGDSLWRTTAIEQFFGLQLLTINSSGFRQVISTSFVQ